jgi:hypothetical protein
LCFSDELGGMPYTTEELSTIEEHAVVVESVKPERKKKESVQINVEPVKTITKDTVRIRTLLDDIKKSDSMSDLVELWKSNEDLHSEVMFKNAMTFRKNQLKESENFVQVKESIEEPSLIAKINACETIDQIFDLTVEVSDPDVLKAADAKIKEIYSNDPIDTVKNEIEGQN